MMRALRDVKVDNNSVGWYQCSYLGSFCTKDTIAHQVRMGAGQPPAAARRRAPCHALTATLFPRPQVDFQTAIPGSVLIVYDGLRTGLGQLAVKVRARAAAAPSPPLRRQRPRYLRAPSPSLQAVRLTDSFLSALKKGKIGIDACVRARCRPAARALPARCRPPPAAAPSCRPVPLARARAPIPQRVVAVGVADFRGAAAAHPQLCAGVGGAV